MPTLIYFQHDGELHLADADHVDQVRRDIHARAAMQEWVDVLRHDPAGATTQVLEEIYAEDAAGWCELDGATVPDDPDLWPAPHRGWDVRRLLTDMANDHPPSVLADAPVTLPAGLDDIWDLAKVAGGFMSPDRPYFPASVANDVLHRLREAGVRLQPDPYLTSPWACVENHCSCHDTSRPDEPQLIRSADPILPWLWIGDGDHMPSTRFGTVVTVADFLSSAVDPQPGVEHLVAPLVDSQFRPLDREPFERAVTTVIDAVRRGDTVLVRCQAGINRSALVTGEALARMGWDRSALVDLIRNRRPHALANPFFADVVRGVATPDMQRKETTVTD